ncbi:hypothetical protein HYT91_03010 [Candidatus Pacearchaeota archaeon]|nr:hypothetical protein [Candidatus Pacearchaeota archaeon]
MICPHCKKEIKLERGEKQKLGMIKRASKGNHVSRVPFGYKWDYENKKIIPAQNYQEVEEIFNEFLQEDMKLTNHKPIISSILFNKVQDKLERLKRKKNY